MDRKEFLRLVFFKFLAIFFFMGLFAPEILEANTKKKTSKTSKKGKKAKKNKRTRSNRRSRKTRGRKRRFTYKRGGPDLRVLTKDSNFNHIPDNGITPVEAPFMAPTGP